MGNVCCGSGKESAKAGAFTAARGGGGGDLTSEIDGNKWDAASAGDSSGGALSGGGGGAGATPGSSALAATANNNGSDPFSMMEQQQQQHQQSQADENNAANSSSAAAAANSANAAAALLLRQEQARLEIIVQAAGRGMVAVRSTRGSNAYYDQGFAAALGQHLEQTTTFPQHVVSRQLPPFESSSSINSSSSSNMTTTSSGGTGSGNANTASSSLGDGAAASNKTMSNSSVYARLNQPAWEFIQLGTKRHGLAGCAGENPQAYFDHVAESFLDEIVPHKQRLFANNTGVQPIVESLL
jgi:hypothetical protein